MALLQLPSPAAGAPQQFVLLPGGGGLLEVNRVCHEYGAWLIGDRLVAGALLILTLISCPLVVEGGALCSAVSCRWSGKRQL